MALPSTNVDCIDVHGGANIDDQANRFVYGDKPFWSRLFVGAELKTALVKNRVGFIKYRKWSMPLLVVCLLSISVAFTPRALPDLFGFEWASPRDFCQDRSTKLDGIEKRVLALANVPQGLIFLKNLENEISCMTQSAQNFYHGNTSSPQRVLWPNGCTPDMVSETLNRKICKPQVRYKKTICVKVKGIQKAIAWVGGIDTCREEWIEPVCSMVVDKDAQSALFNISNEREAAKTGTAANETISYIDYGAATNQKMKDAMTEVVNRVDIASNLYIFYTICTLVFARPLIVFKRRKRTRVLGATFGMGKATFTLLVVASVTVFDSVSSILKETDIKSLMSNFANDPCWVDPEFSLSRGDLIRKTCHQVVELHVQTSESAKKLDDLYFKVKLFGLCPSNGTRSPHPNLKAIGLRRDMYASGALRNPAICNASNLNKETETPPAADTSALHILESGVLAQLLAKIVFSNFLLHLFSYFEPMLAYAGQVELWGGDDMSDGEEQAVICFARDKHLLPCVLYSVVTISLLSLIAFAATKSIGEGSFLSQSGYTNTSVPATLADGFQPGTTSFCNKTMA